MISKPKKFHVNYETDIIIALNKNKFRSIWYQSTRLLKFIFLLCLRLCKKGFNSCNFVMLTRLKFQRGEGKLLVVSPNIRKRRKRDEKASSSPKFPLKAALEAPQVPSPVVEIKEVKIAQEVQALDVELESLAIMLVVGENHEHS